MVIWGKKGRRAGVGKYLKGESSVFATFYCQQYKANMAKKNISIFKLGC